MSLKEAMLYQGDRIINEAQKGKGFKYWLLRKTLTKEKFEKQVEGPFEKAIISEKEIFAYGGGVLGTQYMKEHGSLTGADYANKLKDYSGKVLAITGTGDIQADYTALQKIEGKDNIEVFAPEGVNHILREIDDNNSMLTYMKQYKRLSKNPLHKGTLDIISMWLKDNFSTMQISEQEMEGK